jgi:hypothetical protein
MCTTFRNYEGPDMSCIIFLLSATRPNPGEFGSQKYSTQITCPDHNATNPPTVAADSSALSTTIPNARLVSTPNAPSFSSRPRQPSHSIVPAGKDLWKSSPSLSLFFFPTREEDEGAGDDSLGPRLACSAHPASLPVPPPR